MATKTTQQTQVQESNQDQETKSQDLPFRRTILSSYALGLLVLLFSFWASHIYNLSFSPWKILDHVPSLTGRRYVCNPDHQYTTEIVSVDPLLLYINNFVSDEEARFLVTLGEPNLKESLTARGGGKGQKDPGRTSQSAKLPVNSSVVQCILSRASLFMGELHAVNAGFVDPQMVRYQPGERYDEHYDWYGRPQNYQGTWHDRVGSFFVYLEAEGVVGGETWFPRIEANTSRKGKGKWMRRVGGDEEGGTMFAPKKGNGLFWVNLYANGTGDKRVKHAGLPVVKGTKSAMNLWPRKIYDNNWRHEYPHLRRPRG